MYNFIVTTSSDIRLIEHDGFSTLTVHFISGGIYEFYNVPKTVYDSFIMSSSKGKFMHTFIRDKYLYKRIY